MLSVEVLPPSARCAPGPQPGRKAPRSSQLASGAMLETLSAANLAWLKNALSGQLEVEHRHARLGMT